MRTISAALVAVCVCRQHSSDRPEPFDQQLHPNPSWTVTNCDRARVSRSEVSGNSRVTEVTLFTQTVVSHNGVLRCVAKAPMSVYLVFGRQPRPNLKQQATKILGFTKIPQLTSLSPTTCPIQLSEKQNKSHVGNQMLLPVA